MRFSEAEGFLLAQRRLGMKFGLQNMTRAMSLLGDPQRGLMTVHVAGSKGKGSFCALLESILLASGAAVGLYTSPHLVSVRERIRVGGRPISPRLFGVLVESVQARLGRSAPPLTYFEWLTAMALRHFRDRGVSTAVVEAGLGGRLDATNVVNSSLAVITEIEREHTEYLGETLGEIASEKAGIVKEGAVVLSGASPPAARKALEAATRARGGRLRSLHREASWEVVSHSLRGLKVDLALGGERYDALAVGLLGRHQTRNAALAVLAARELREGGVPITDGDIRRGLAQAAWPGRCDYRRGAPSWFLDGCHTPSSASALASAVGDLFPSRRRVLLFGVLGDKKLPLLADRLFPFASAVVVVAPPEERAVAPREVIRRLPKALRPLCVAASGTGDGMARAASAAGRGGVVVVAGSLFLVGDVIRRLEGVRGKTLRPARRPP